jgi:hypothetical protein
VSGGIVAKERKVYIYERDTFSLGSLAIFKHYRGLPKLFPAAEHTQSRSISGVFSLYQPPSSLLYDK